MNLLAIDTSTERMAVAVHTATGSWAACAAGGAQASATLLPAVQRLLPQAGLRLDGLHALAFGRGPGAFTGLRTSCAVIQGLGLGLNLPVWPLDSLAIVAEDAWSQVASLGAPLKPLLRCATVVDARMGEAYAALWQRWPGAIGPSASSDTLNMRCGAWMAVHPAALVDPRAFARMIGAGPPNDAARGQIVAPQAADVWAGSGLLAFDLPGAWAQAAIQLTAEHDRAGALLRLALAECARTPGLSADQALPLYLRDKVALTTDERRAVAKLAQPG